MNPKIIYDARPYGNCPVQSEGTINGLPFYFRSRGGHWRLSIARTPKGDPFDYQNCLVHLEEYKGRHHHRDLEINDGHLFAAGWADKDECVEFIERAARLLLGNGMDGVKHNPE